MIAAVSKCWVLVVEDDDAARDAIVALLQCEPDLAAVGVASGDEALRVLGTFRVQAVVVDLVMPGMNGLDLIERLRAGDATRDIPIVVATGLEPGVLAREVAAASYPLVPKPFDPDALLSTIRSVLVRRGGEDRRSGTDRRR